VDFVEICNVCARKAIIKVAKRKINFDKICHSYSDLNFGVTFLEHSVFETADFCFSLLHNPEIEALNPETGHQTSKPGDFGSDPESWQP